MKVNRLLISFAIAMTFHVCRAETRWCSLTGKAGSDTLLYPPIARAAHISGTVIGRLHFSTSGKVEEFEVISGPIMLSRAVADQVKSWTVQTDSKGEQPCQSLFAVNFTIGDEAPIPSDSRPSLFRVSVHAEQLVLTSTPSVASTR
jgi:hypothetical protein